MKQSQTNVGKKEQRQIDRLLTKEQLEGRRPGSREAESRTVPKQHRLKGHRAKG